MASAKLSIHKSYLESGIVASKVASRDALFTHSRWLRCLSARGIVCPSAQEASPSPSPGETEAEPVVVSATRFDIPLDQSPASVSVITSEDLEKKQIERVSDALREVPGLSVVQTGTAGQLTSVFTRGLRSEHTQVLLDGIPINQGLQGAINFADLTTDDIDRIEVVRGPQSTCTARARWQA